MYPMQLIAPCKDYLWGGTRLREEFGKTSDKEKNRRKLGAVLS